MIKIILIFTSLLISNTILAQTIDISKENILNDTIVIDKSKLKLYYFNNVNDMFEFPVSVGKPKTPSRTGQFSIIRKAKNPIWYPPDSIRFENPKKILPAVVPPGRKNPLGTRAIYLSNGLFRIHGTNKESSIGKSVTHGCFRMKNKDIEQLYEMVTTNTKVYVVEAIKK